jgi:FixJ family two-component response regulator
MIQEPILIVDDEAEVRVTLLEALQERGYSAEAVASGEAALVRLAERSFPVVLTDLICAIQHQFPGTLCILITGYATLDTSIEALKRGAYDLILKPFRLAEVEVVLNRALDHATLLRKLSAYREELEVRILNRTRELQAAHLEALTLCDLCLQSLEASTLAASLEPLLGRVAALWAPDGLACYRSGEGTLTRLVARGPVALPLRLDPPRPGPLQAPGLGYPEEHLLPLGAAGWLYLGFEGRSAFLETDPTFLLLARHLQLVLRVR